MPTHCSSPTPNVHRCSAGFAIAALLLAFPVALTAQTSATDATAPPMIIPESTDAAKLALKLTNPVASLISIPIQNWFDFNLGPKKDGFRYTVEAQPVYPMKISENWNLISRTTIPTVYQQNVYGRTTQTGLSDSTESLFLSPVHTKSFIWGAGPIFLVPTGTYGALSTRKFGLGLRQSCCCTKAAPTSGFWATTCGRSQAAAIADTSAKPMRKPSSPTRPRKPGLLPQPPTTPAT